MHLCWEGFDVYLGASGSMTVNGDMSSRYGGDCIAVFNTSSVGTETLDWRQPTVRSACSITAGVDKSTDTSDLVAFMPCPANHHHHSQCSALSDGNCNNSHMLDSSSCAPLPCNVCQHLAAGNCKLPPGGESGKMVAQANCMVPSGNETGKMVPQANCMLQSGSEMGKMVAEANCKLPPCGDGGKAVAQANCKLHPGSDTGSGKVISQAGRNGMCIHACASCATALQYPENNNNGGRSVSLSLALSTPVPRCAALHPESDSRASVKPDSMPCRGSSKADITPSRAPCKPEANPRTFSRTEMAPSRSSAKPESAPSRASAKPSAADQSQANKTRNGREKTTGKRLVVASADAACQAGPECLSVDHQMDDHGHGCSKAIVGGRGWNCTEEERAGSGEGELDLTLSLAPPGMPSDQSRLTANLTLEKSVEVGQYGGIYAALVEHGHAADMEVLEKTCTWLMSRKRAMKALTPAEAGRILKAISARCNTDACREYLELLGVKADAGIVRVDPQKRPKALGKVGGRKEDRNGGGLSSAKKVQEAILNMRREEEERQRAATAVLQSALDSKDISKMVEALRQYQNSANKKVVREAKAEVERRLFGADEHDTNTASGAAAPAGPAHYPSPSHAHPQPHPHAHMRHEDEEDRTCSCCGSYDDDDCTADNASEDEEDEDDEPIVERADGGRANGSSSRFEGTTGMLKPWDAMGAELILGELEVKRANEALKKAQASGDVQKMRAELDNPRNKAATPGVRHCVQRALKKKEQKKQSKARDGAGTSSSPGGKSEGGSTVSGSSASPIQSGKKAAPVLSLPSRSVSATATSERPNATSSASTSDFAPHPPYTHQAQHGTKRGFASAMSLLATLDPSSSSSATSSPPASPSPSASTSNTPATFHVTPPLRRTLSAQPTPYPSTQPLLSSPNKTPTLMPSFSGREGPAASSFPSAKVSSDVASTSASSTISFQSVDRVGRPVQGGGAIHTGKRTRSSPPPPGLQGGPPIVVASRGGERTPEQKAMPLQKAHTRIVVRADVDVPGLQRSGSGGGMGGLAGGLEGGSALTRTSSTSSKSFRAALAGFEAISTSPPQPDQSPFATSSPSPISPQTTLTAPLIPSLIPPTVSPPVGLSAVAAAAGSWATSASNLWPSDRAAISASSTIATTRRIIARSNNAAATIANAPIHTWTMSPSTSTSPPIDSSPATPPNTTTAAPSSTRTAPTAAIPVPVTSNRSSTRTSALNAASPPFVPAAYTSPGATGSTQVRNSGFGPDIASGWMGSSSSPLASSRFSEGGGSPVDMGANHGGSSSGGANGPLQLSVSPPPEVMPNYQSHNHHPHRDSTSGSGEIAAWGSGSLGAALAGMNPSGMGGQMSTHGFAVAVDTDTRSQVNGLSASPAAPASRFTPETIATSPTPSPSASTLTPSALPPSTSTTTSRSGTWANVAALGNLRNSSNVADPAQQATTSSTRSNTPAASTSAQVNPGWHPASSPFRNSTSNPSPTHSLPETPPTSNTPPQATRPTTTHMGSHMGYSPHGRAAAGANTPPPPSNHSPQIPNAVPAPLATGRGVVTPPLPIAVGRGNAHTFSGGPGRGSGSGPVSGSSIGSVVVRGGSGPASGGGILQPGPSAPSGARYAWPAAHAPRGGGMSAAVGTTGGSGTGPPGGGVRGRGAVAQAGAGMQHATPGVLSWSSIAGQQSTTSSSGQGLLGHGMSAVGVGGTGGSAASPSAGARPARGSESDGTSESGEHVLRWLGLGAEQRPAQRQMMEDFLKQQVKARPTADELDDDDGLCVICLERESDTMYKPCGHSSFCRHCAKWNLTHHQSCPVCRQPVDDLSARE